MKFNYLKAFGSGCYELSGERSKNNNYTLDQFVQDMLNVFLTVTPDDDCNKHLPDHLISEIMQGIKNKEMGDSYGLSFDYIVMKNGSDEELLEQLNNIYISEEDYNSLNKKSLDKILHDF